MSKSTFVPAGTSVKRCESESRYSYRVRHRAHAVILRRTIQQFEQQSIVRMHRERDRAHVQQVEIVRSDDAMQGSIRMFAQHVGAFHADLQRQTVIPVRAGRFEIEPEQRLRLHVQIFVLFPHDSSFQLLCHSMISICVSRCAVPSSSSHHQSPFQSRIGTLSGARQLGMM